MKNFKNPKSEWRARTFWSLNGSLEEKELKRQIGVLHRMGFGGAYLHSRTGLSTEYLGEEWFRLMNVCADELSRRGMIAYLYDEDRYPSGVAGGYVPMDPAFRGKYITVRFTSAPYQSAEGDIAAFSVQFDGETLLSYAPYAGGEGEVAVFSVHEREPQDVYNGYPYFDALKKEATEAFLRITLDGYAAAMGERIGGSVEGVFTDEPNRGAVFNGFAHMGEDTERRVPYTEELFPAYEARWGEKLETILPELYFRGRQPFSRTAWRYLETLTALFIENYAVPYENWCKAHGMTFTGHILHEDNLSAMTTLCGSPMRFYEHMDVPGVDNLTANSTNIAVPVMAASVARQCGKKGVLSEMYAAIGWQTDFSTYKRIGDWHALFGVTDRCTHLSMYTMAGIAKRDFPASLLHQSVWWKDYKLVEDYFARLNVFLAQGKREADVLWVHPVETAWGLGRMEGYVNCFVPKDEKYLSVEGVYWQTSNLLAEKGVAFDFGDEEMMSRLARVDKKHGRIVVGKASYMCLLLAGSVSLRASTVALVRDFLKAGGRVVIGGEQPTLCEGEPLGENVFAGAERFAVEKLPLAFKLGFRVGGGKAYTHFARAGKKAYLAAVSIETAPRHFVFEIDGRFGVERYDARKGTHAPCSAIYCAGKTMVDTTLDAGEEILLVCTEGERPTPLPQKSAGEAVALPGEVNYTLSQPNVCVLDFCEYAAGNTKGEGEILLADRVLREALRLPQRTPEAIQPWFREKFGLKTPCGAATKLRFSFSVEKKPSALSLIFEPIAGAKLYLNGVRVRGVPKKTDWDNCFFALKLPVSALTEGENVLEVRFAFEEDTPVEAMYLSGDFGVRLEGRRATLTELPQTLKMGDICPQGLPFYSGEIRYRFPLERGKYTVSLGEFGGALARIGGETCAFRPFRRTVVSEGELEVSVVITQKNKFGPLHFGENCLGAYGEFCPPPEQLKEEYCLIRQGLFEAPTAAREDHEES